MAEHQDVRSADPARAPSASATATPLASATRSHGGEVPRESITKPLLASEALMDDLAPVEPARSAARIWCAALAVGWIVLGVLPLAGLREGGANAALPAFVLGGVAVVASLARVTYQQRAIAMLVLGVLSAALGFWGRGPAAGIALGGFGWAGLRLLVATVLPGALVFRARYRAYPGARMILGAAFASAIPFIILAVVRLMRADMGLPQAGMALAVLAIICSLSGFMGANTTAAGSYLALSVIASLTIELALEALGAPGALSSLGVAAHGITSALVFAGIAAVLSLALFQLLAWRFAWDARRIDLHRPTVPSNPESVPRRSSSDWSTRT